MVACCVPGCYSNIRKNRKKYRFTFHEFPSDDIHREQWVDAIPRENWVPNVTAVRICNLHFLPSDYRPGLRIRCLNPSAVPSQFPNHPSHHKLIQRMKKTSQETSSRKEVKYTKRLKKHRFSSRRKLIRNKAISKARSKIINKNKYEKLIVRYWKSLLKDKETRTEIDCNSVQNNDTTNKDSSVTDVETNGTNVNYSVTDTETNDDTNVDCSMADFEVNDHDDANVDCSIADVETNNDGNVDCCTADVETNEKQLTPNVQQKNNNSTASTDSNYEQLSLKLNFYKKKAFAYAEMIQSMEKELAEYKEFVQDSHGSPYTASFLELIAVAEEGDSSAMFLLDLLKNFNKNKASYDNHTLCHCLKWFSLSKTAYEYAKNDLSLPIPSEAILLKFAKDAGKTTGNSCDS